MQDLSEKIRALEKKHGDLRSERIARFIFTAHSIWCNHAKKELGKMTRRWLKTDAYYISKRQTNTPYENKWT